MKEIYTLKNTHFKDLNSLMYKFHLSKKHIKIFLNEAKHAIKMFMLIILLLKYFLKVFIAFFEHYINSLFFHY